MKKFVLIGTLLLSTTAIANNNTLPSRPVITNNNVKFGNAVIQVEKKPIQVEKPKEGKPTNKLISSDEFPSVDGYFEGPLPQVIINDKPEGGDGEGSGGDEIIEVGLFPQPVCDCVGNIHIDPIIDTSDNQGATE